MEVYKDSALVMFLFPLRFCLLRAPPQYLPPAFILAFSVSLFMTLFYWLVQIESGSSVRVGKFFSL